MPHKRNPILSERLSGLARVLRGYLGRGARGRGAVARARHLPQLGRARHPPRRLPARLLRAAPRRRARRGPGRPHRPDARQRARGLLRAGLQPARAAGAGGVGAGRATPPTASSSATPGWPGRSGGRSGPCSRTTPRSRLGRRRARRGLRPRPRAAPRVTGSPTHSRRSRGEPDVGRTAGKVRELYDAGRRTACSWWRRTASRPSTWSWPSPSPTRAGCSRP